MELARCLQLQADLLRIQIECAELKEYSAGWLKDGKKVMRQGGKFASKGESISESDRKLIEKASPFLDLPESAYNQTIASRLKKLRELQAKTDADRKELGAIQSSIDSFNGSARGRQLLELSFRSTVKALNERIFSQSQEQERRKQMLAMGLAVSVLGKVLGGTITLKPLQPFANVLTVPGKIHNAIAKKEKNLGKAVGEQVNRLNEKLGDSISKMKPSAEKSSEKEAKATELIKKGVAESAKKAEERNQQNKLDVAKRYEKEWQKEKQQWSADKAIKAAEDLGSDIADHVKSALPSKAIAAAKSDDSTDFADVLELLQDPSIDFDFLFYLLSKPDFRAAILQEVAQ